MPEISVIVPVYNTAAYLEECLNSLCAQTFRDFELICVDDGSTDKSSQILEKFAKKYPFIRVLTQTNQGQGAARNAGKKAARGAWISFVDSDDWVEPNFLEHLHDIALKYDVDIVQCQLIKYIGKVSAASRIQVVLEPLLNAKVSFSPVTKFYRRNLISDHDFIEGISYEDYPWVVTLLSRVRKMVFSDARLYHYRMNPNSTTKSVFTPRKVQGYWTGLKYVATYFSENHLSFDYVRKKLVPNILKSQLKLIEAEKDQEPLLRIFAQELQWTKENNLFAVLHHKLKRLWKYHQIMRRYGNF